MSGSLVRSAPTPAVEVIATLGDSIVGIRHVSNPRGGRMKYLGNAEFFMPVPGLQGERSARMSAFLDVGTTGNRDDMGDVRLSMGIAALWVSPLGPLKMNIGLPILKEPGDRKQYFQFTFGGAF